jgi:hypothetical protein
MTSFFNAMTTADTLTENAMPTHLTSGSFLLDWFFHMGAMRARPEGEILLRFQRAFAEDRALATKSLFALRNIRGGMGERRAFRVILKWLAEHYPEIVTENMHNIPHYGRWDDVLATIGTPAEHLALSFIFAALMDGEKLCAKWMPREGKKNGRMARYLAKAFEISAKQYRKLLANNTEVVESLMCRNAWGEINFAHVPSVAYSRYRKAFARHEPDRFSEFIASVEKGEKKVHADAIFPHSVVSNLYSWSDREGWRAAEAQWKNLPDYGPPTGTLAVCDVSGSMSGEPMDVSIALGIYFSERLDGPFKDMICTFSYQPEFVRLSGTLQQKYQTVANAHWAMNTNLEAVFDLILRQATKHNLPQGQMPKNILILSDMQFDQCIRNPGDDALTMIRRRYGLAGYEIPQVIFWNLRSSIGTPAKADDSDVVLLSGYSPALMRSVLGGKVNPYQIMLDTLNHPQYDRVVV